MGFASLMVCKNDAKVFGERPVAEVFTCGPHIVEGAIEKRLPDAELESRVVSRIIPPDQLRVLTAMGRGDKPVVKRFLEPSRYVILPSVVFDRVILDIVLGVDARVADHASLLNIPWVGLTLVLVSPR